MITTFNWLITLILLFIHICSSNTATGFYRYADEQSTNIGYKVRRPSYTYTFGFSLNTQSSPLSYGTLTPHLAVEKTATTPLTVYPPITRVVDDDLAWALMPN